MNQSIQLSRVQQRIAPIILDFYAYRLFRNPYFHMNELFAYVEKNTLIAPASPDRILRALRQEGKLDYIVVDRRASYYLLRSPL